MANTFGNGHGLDLLEVLGVVQLDPVGIALDVSATVGQRFPIMPFTKGEGVLQGMDDLLVGWRTAITSTQQVINVKANDAN